jgi:serine/threonine protein kinase
MFAGRYEIQSRLGSGGMAEVLLARDRGSVASWP